MEKTFCGYVGILGAPNAGKSTLINHIVQSKVSIVSAKVQTTRRNILGIVTNKNNQIILVDTPGIFAAKKKLDKAMVKSAWSVFGTANVICLLVDVSRKDYSQTKEIIEGLKALETDIPVVLVLNKIDSVAKELLLDATNKLQSLYNFAHIFMISAKTGDGVNDLFQALEKMMPASPFYYDEDQMTDILERDLVSEIVREELFHALFDELPYSVTVETEKWENFDNGSAKIHCTVFVMRESQKPIILGKRGALIKRVGERARFQLKKMLERDVHLFLHVKVKDWSNSAEHFKNMGLEFEGN